MNIYNKTSKFKNESVEMQIMITHKVIMMSVLLKGKLRTFSYFSVDTKLSQNIRENDKLKLEYSHITLYIYIIRRLGGTQSVKFLLTNHEALS